MKNSVLGKIQTKVNLVKTEERQLAEYLSQFDFESFQISGSDKEYVVEREAIFIKNGKIYAESVYEMCMALFEVKNRLVSDYEIGFMAWYEHIGLNKDKVSSLLKRARLYFDFPEHKAFITSLSDRAIRAITGKNSTFEIQRDLIENQVTSVIDIKDSINFNETHENKLVITHTHKWKYLNEKTVIKINKSIDNMNKKEIFEAKAEIENFRRLLKDAEKKLKLKELEFENDNNLKLVSE
ncbi:hypothetical protein [Cetobacterium somerae]|uniref:hypothetical protein n=1 Tax=Cetobacterium somerae TaxID=188913 RepID=UPI00248DE5C6|nr:hypothetical protein [Cetobacterium somerae]